MPDRDATDVVSTLVWTVAPPAAGKTEAAVQAARAAAEQGQRVTFVAPAWQRWWLLRRLARGGPLLGVEVVTLQQTAYLAMADARRPLLTGTGRLAAVARALAQDRGEPPAPGEARLFARAIAELKRFRVPPSRFADNDPELWRLQRIASAFERAKDGAWDYDDYLAHATDRLRGTEHGSPLEADLVLVDGAPELDPAEVRFLAALARHHPLQVYSETAPPGIATRALPSAKSAATPAERPLPPRTVSHRFPNPVTEARWILRDVKAELAAGRDPLDLMIIVPPGRARALAFLGEEFGVPLMDETPLAPADRPQGRRLIDRLEAMEFPTPARLLAIPELRPVAAAALKRGLAGSEAMARLARELGADAAWSALQQEGEVPSSDGAALLGWGEQVVRRALRASDEPLPRDREQAFLDEALARLTEAARVARGGAVRGWWVALLQEPGGREAAAAGVPLVEARAAVGRRAERVWIAFAQDGAHQRRESEDYFVPEEERAGEQDTQAEGVLPKRYQGRQQARTAHLRVRGSDTVVTFHGGDREGAAPADRALVGDAVQPVPTRPAGSPDEARPGPVYRPPTGRVALGAPEVGRLLRYHQCGFRAWAEGRLNAAARRDRDGAEDAEATEVADANGRALLRALLARSRHQASDLERLAQEHPQHADWLARHASRLAELRFGVPVPLPASDADPFARLHAAAAEGRQVRLVRFTAPGTADSAEAAARIVRDSAEAWAAQRLLTRHRDRFDRVTVVVWPLGGEPVPYPPQGFGRADAGMERLASMVEEALPGWLAGRVDPTPGFHCRDCPVFDLCREGRR